MIWNVIENEAGERQLIPSADPVPEGWTVLVQTANPDYLIPPPAEPLTKLAFRRRFTLAERVAFDNYETLGLDAQTTAIMKTFTADFGYATEILLDDPDIIAGLQLMESVGIIGPGRAAEILEG